METIEEESKTKDPAHHTGKGPEVTIKVDGEPVKIHRGDYPVAEFKKLIGVPPSQELEQVIDGQFKLLDNDDRIEIRGGEIFVSHGKGGGSS